MALPIISPALVLALIVSSIYALVFFLFFGRSWARLVLDWFAAISGFALGHWLASVVGLGVFNVGEARWFEGTLVSVVFLFVTRSWKR